MRVAVVGMGGTGSAAARFLAQAGHTVVAFEQFQVGHSQGSSHGESRVIRYTYPDEVYTRMMAEAYPLWQELQEEAGETLLVRTGGVFFGDKASPVLTQARAALDLHEIPNEMLTAVEAERRFPVLRLAEGEAALFQPDMGYLRATACVLANARLARQHGAEIREGMRVRQITQAGAQVVVTTEGGAEEAFDRILVTAGPWMGKIFSALRLPLRVTRQQIVYLKPEPGAEADFAPERLPVWVDADTYRYGFPSDGQIPGVKLAWHAPGEDADPDGPRRPPDADTSAHLADYAAARFRGLSRAVTHAETCLYTNTPDEDFIVDTLPAMPHVWLISGCSGHGFKFTVLLGKLAAEAATLGAVPHYLARFALSRFNMGKSS